jgi:hypothetical protein
MTGSPKLTSPGVAPPEVDINVRTDAARADLRQALVTAFCHVLHASRLPPMTVLSLAASAVGSIYREVAEAHHGNDPCPCGWRPSPPADVEALQAALAMTARAFPALDLRIVQVSGRA